MVEHPPNSLPRDPLLWLVVATFIVVNLPYVIPVFSGSVFDVYVEYFTIPPLLVAGIFACQQRLRSESDARARWFWGLWSMGLLFNLVVRIAYIFTRNHGPSIRASVIFELLYVFAYLSIIVALTLRPGRETSQSEERLRRRLEIPGAAVFLAGVFVYFVVIPAWIAPDAYVSSVPSLLHYTILDSFIFLALVYLRLTERTTSWRVTYTWLAAVALLWSVTDMLEALQWLEVLPDTTTGTLWDSLWYAPYLLVGVAARARVSPWPLTFAHGGISSDPPMPWGVLVAYASLLPIFHFVFFVTDVLDPTTHVAREAVALGTLTILLGMAFIYQRALERETAQLELVGKHESDRRRLLSSAVDQAAEGIAIADESGRIVYANSAFDRVAGSGTSVLGLDLVSLVDRSADKATLDELRQILQSGTSWEGHLSTDPSDPTQPSDEEVISISPVRAESGISHYVAIGRDVTQEWHLERQLRQSQKMEALGTLAGGIAHDFNNILMAIFGYSEVLKRDPLYGGKNEKAVDGILNAANRAKALVSQVLAFSRRDQGNFAPVAVSDTVRESVRLLRATLPSSVTIESHVDDDVGWVRADPDQLYQLFLNLGANASHAIRGQSGTIVVRAARQRLTGALAEQHSVVPGDYVRIEVSDSGKGIEPVCLERIFDPFFTTKPVGQGTGLGLSVVHGIVQNHLGAISATSEVGKGSTFVIWLPLTSPPDRQKEAPADVASLEMGAGHILVVDDESDVRWLVEQQLERLGYRVTMASTGSELLQELETNSAAFDLVLTDQAMPGLTGTELAAEIKALRSDLPVLLMTGYHPKGGGDDLARYGVDGVLGKPFGISELGTAVRRMIRR